MGGSATEMLKATGSTSTGPLARQAGPVRQAGLFERPARAQIFSAATPALQVRIEELRHVLPLPFVEASHLLSCVVGLCLMVSAQGLFRRVDSAYWLTASLLTR